MVNVTKATIYCQSNHQIWTQSVILCCVQALEEKSNSLHVQRMHQLALERECSRLRLELERIRELQPQINGVNALSHHQHFMLLSSMVHVWFDIRPSIAYTAHSILPAPLETSTSKLADR